MSAQSQEEILGQVKGLISGIIGQSVDLNDQEISLDTSFSHDLELESIEFVVLSEKLQTEFGRGVDFSAWLSGKELDEIINLKVRDVVGFIAECRN